MTHVYGEAALSATGTLVVATARVPTTAAGALRSNGETRCELVHDGETKSQLGVF